MSKKHHVIINTAQAELLSEACAELLSANRANDEQQEELELLAAMLDELKSTPKHVTSDFTS